jgi:hypothetical protein
MTAPELAPADRLAHVVRSLVRHLPGQVPTLLAAPPFEDGRAALGRLAAPGGAASAVAGVRPAEAARLADLLLERWAAVAEVVVDPGAVVVGPAEVWVADRPRTVAYQVATIGVDDGWTAEWSAGGPVVDIPVPEGDDEVVRQLTVRVFGRVRGRREVVVGERTVLARRPVARLAPGGTALLVTDHRGRPAAEVDVEVDGAPHRTDRSGVVVLAAPVGPGVSVVVDGQAAGWAGG